MLEPALSLLPLGVLLGMRHALDPDHVVAVSTIVTRAPSLRRAAVIGACWGIGHTATVLLVGGSIILLRVTIAPRVGLAMELAVAVMLVGLGFANLRRPPRPPRPPRPDADVPGLGPTRGHDDAGRPTRATRGSDVRRPLLVGMVHGLAGSAAVALLVVATIAEPRWALLALLLFGVGTVLGMVAVTCVLGSAAGLASRQLIRSRGWVAAGAGALSIALGLYLAAGLVGDGLFGATPRWTPR